MSRRAIVPLPEDVVAQIHSSVAITSLSDVVLELLKNSLDAEASSIDVALDFGRGYCSVEDDGVGISPLDFEASGGLGKAFHTSKYDSARECLGSRGMFLSSLASLSILSITSHHIDHRFTNTLILHHSKPVARLLPTPEHNQLVSGAHGTRVIVQDLFGNMPVRVKQRPSSEADHRRRSYLWDALCKKISGVLLASNRHIKLSMTGSDRDHRLRIKPPINSDPRMISSSGKGFDSTWIRTVLIQGCGLAASDWEHWTKISARTKVATVRAFVSAEPAPSRGKQFISLGTAYIDGSDEHNILYDEVNRIFASSSFGNQGDQSEIPRSDANDTKDQRHQRHQQDQQKDLVFNSKRPMKNVDRWPMFYIRIDMNDAKSCGDIGAASHGKSRISLQLIMEMINAMLVGFLAANHLRPRQKRKLNIIESLHDNRDSRLRRPIMRGKNALGSWTRIKSGSHREIDSLRRTAGSKDATPERRQMASSSDRERIEDSNLKTSQPTSDERSRAASLQDDDMPISGGSSELINAANTIDFQDSPGREGEDSSITWIHPISKKTISLDGRTGHVFKLDAVAQDPVPPGLQDDSARNTRLSRRSSGLLDLALLSRAIDTPSRTQSDGSWAAQLLDDWENPVFKSREEPILSMASCSSIPDNTIPIIGRRHANHLACQVARKDESDVATGIAFSKVELQQSQVIGQVDKKFILVALQGPSDTREALPGAGGRKTVVIIDQHAADERVRLEALFEELCKPPPPSAQALVSSLGLSSSINTVTLKNPILFPISAAESSLFRRYASHFADWGILFDLQTPPRASQAALQAITVSVLTLPSVIAERCRADPDQLVALMRREVFAREESPMHHHRPTEHGSHQKQVVATASTNAHETEISTSTSTSTSALYSTSALTATSTSTLTSNSTSTSTSTSTWLSRIWKCPRGMLDLIASRSCRSAIMLNDALSIEECEALVSRLAECVLPFQCAHGRPSVVPIAQLESTALGLGDGGFLVPEKIVEMEKREKKRSFAEAWTAWS